MAALADALQHQREAELTRNENAIVSAWQGILPASTDVNGQMILPFVQFCNERTLRYCPARPHTVALYVKYLLNLGVDGIPHMLDAIQQLHDQCGYSNPVATHPVRLALEDLAANTPAPRSWTKEEKLSWPMLPAEVRLALARRAQQTERELRRMQNDLAEAKRKIGDSEKIAETKKETENMTKKINYKTGAGPGVGDYSATDMPLVKGDAGLGDPLGKSKDISKVVDKNHAVNDGFSGGLSDK